MPFVQAQGTVEFNTNYSGWTETYWPVGTDYTTSLAALNVIVNARVSILPDTCTMIAFKVSDVAVRGDVNYATTANVAGTWSAVGLHPALALLATWGSDFVHRRFTKYLHGVPSDQVTGLFYTPTAPYAALVSSFLSAVRLNSLARFRTVPPPPVGVYPYTFIPINGTGGIERLVSHRVGRPFGAFRGRRPIR